MLPAGWALTRACGAWVIRLCRVLCNDLCIKFAALHQRVTEGARLCSGLECRKYRLDYGQGSARVCGHDRGMLDRGATLPASFIDAHTCCTRRHSTNPIVCQSLRTLPRYRRVVSCSVCLRCRPWNTRGSAARVPRLGSGEETHAIKPPRLVWGLMRAGLLMLLLSLLTARLPR